MAPQPWREVRVWEFEGVRVIEIKGFAYLGACGKVQRLEIRILAKLPMVTTSALEIAEKRGQNSE